MANATGATDSMCDFSFDYCQFGSSFAVKFETLDSSDSCFVAEASERGSETLGSTIITEIMHHELC